MSVSKGNVHRTRPQKHQNKSAFKNDLHDTSKKTKALNALQVSGVCVRCREIIEWKIKYKKYKPLSAPAKCVGCDQKTVRHAYHVLCKECASKKAVCAKCSKPCENTHSLDENKINNDNDIEIQAQLKGLPERKRRTILRKRTCSSPDVKYLLQPMKTMTNLKRYIKKLRSNDQIVSKSDIEQILTDFDKLNILDASLSDTDSSNSDGE